LKLNKLYAAYFKPLAKSSGACRKVGNISPLSGHKFLCKNHGPLAVLEGGGHWGMLWEEIAILRHSPMPMLKGYL
jgi:hypothetical protein